MSVQPLNSPFTGGPARLITTTETITFRGQPFAVTALCYEDETGEQFTTDAQDQQFLDELHRLWRAHNRVPSAAQLKARRLTLSLSAAEVSSLLGFGINVYRQYEAGELPSESNSRALKLFCDPDEAVLAGLVRAAGSALAARTLRKLARVSHPSPSHTWQLQAQAQRYVEHPAFLHAFGEAQSASGGRQATVLTRGYAQLTIPAVS